MLSSIVLYYAANKVILAVIQKLYQISVPNVNVIDLVGKKVMKLLYICLLDGSLFGLGDNSHGQLGIGRIAQPPSSAPPHLVKALLGVPLVEISAGGYHSMALSLSGAVIGWGKNR